MNYIYSYKIIFVRPFIFYAKIIFKVKYELTVLELFLPKFLYALSWKSVSVYFINLFFFKIIKNNVAYLVHFITKRIISSPLFMFRHKVAIELIHISLHNFLIL